LSNNRELYQKIYLFHDITLLKVLFCIVQRVTCKVYIIGTTLSNSVKPVIRIMRKVSKRAPVTQSSPQEQQMANSGNTKPPRGRS